MEMKHLVWTCILMTLVWIGCADEEKPVTHTSTEETPASHDEHDHDHDGHDHSTHEHDMSGEVGELLEIEPLVPDSVDAYAKSIQQQLAGVQRIEVDVTNMALDAGGPGIWKRLDVYKLDGGIVQIEVVPVQGELTETFFYKNWQLVHAFIDINGLNNSVLDESNSALRYYFSQEESIMPSVENMGIPSDEQIRQKGNTVLNVAVNSK